MDTRPTFTRWHRTLLAGFIALASGCLHTEGVVIAPPPDGAVPTELNPVILPRYVIAPPDILYVQVLQAPYTHYLPPKGAPEVKPEVKKEGAVGTPAPEAKKEADSGAYGPVD